MGRSKRNKNNRQSMNSMMAEIVKEKRAQRKKDKDEKRRLIKKQSMEKRYLIGFYGDYRKDTKDHYEVIKPGMGTKFIGSYYTEPEYDLYQIKGAGESALVEGTTSILIEVYEITESILETFDLLLGYTSTREDLCYYVRKQISSPFTDILVYFWNEVIETGDVLVKDGDWLDFLNIQKSKSYLTVKPSDNKGKGTACLELDDEIMADYRGNER